MYDIMFACLILDMFQSVVKIFYLGGDNYEQSNNRV